MSFGGNNIAVEVYGYDIIETNYVANQLAEKMNSIEGARDIQISRDRSKPELQIVLDQNKMIQHVSTAVKNRVGGMIATRLRQFGDEYDVIVRFNEESRNSITDVENIGIINVQGQTIRLGEIAQIKEFWSPPNIEHKRKERIVSVSATPYKRPIGDIAKDINVAIGELDMPAGVMVQISGTIEEQMEALHKSLDI